MKQDYETLLGELVGIARAVDGNEHLITPKATLVVRQCLSAIARDEGGPEQLRESVIDEKRKIVPNCFVCANPCGRTSAFDLREIPEGEIRHLKYAMLDLLCSKAETVEESLLYRCLAVTGMEDYEPQDLLPLIEELSE